MAIFLGTNGNDFIFGRPNEDDQMYGFGGNDNLAADSGADYVNGGDGDDFIFGGGGADALQGGAGADLFVYLNALESSPAGYDNLFDFETGIDRIDLRPLTLSSVSILRQGGSSFIFGRTTIGEDVLITTAGRAVNAADLIFDEAIGVHVVGSSAADTLIGSARGDTIFGLDGADVIQGGDGDDLLYGGLGNDQITGGAGRDIFAYRHYSNEPIFERDDLDFVAAEDLIRLDMEGMISVSLVQIVGGITGVSVVGSGGSRLDLVFAGQIQGNSLAYFPGLTPASITLEHRAGNGVLIGSANAETLYGGSGADVLGGGGGADVFRYEVVSDSSIGAMDIITDFISGNDKLDFRGLGSSIVVNLAFTANAGFIFIDVDGNGSNEMVIGLQNVTAVSVNDFIMTGRFGGPSAAILEPASALFDDGASKLDTPLPWSPQGETDWFLAA